MKTNSIFSLISSLVLLSSMATGCITSQGDLAFQSEVAESEMEASKFTKTNGNRGFYFSRLPLVEISEAAEAARTKLSSNPRDLEALSALATQSIATGNPDGAIAFVKMAGQSGESSDISQLLLGVAYSLNGNSSKASEALLKADALNPNNTLVSLNLGTLALDRGDLNSAAIFFNRALITEPENTTVLLHVGKIGYLTGKYDRAEAVLSKVLQSHPQNGEARYNLALVYYVGKRDYSKARSQLLTIIDGNFYDESIKIRASGTMVSLDRDEHGEKNLASTGAF